MKRYIRSSNQSNKSSYVKSAKEYSDHLVYTRGRQKFSVYFKNSDDPENFQCQVSEIHPYDLADYAWAKKDAPASASIIKNRKVIKTIPVKEYDEDEYEEENEYINDVIDQICVELMHINDKVEPRMDRT